MSDSPAITHTTVWEMIEAVISHSPRTLLYGPPGTGKSHCGAKYAVGSRKVYSCTLTDETPAAELRGHFVPKGDEFTWMHGPVALAMREGARLVLNEIDKASTDALTFLYAVLDDPGLSEIQLPTGEVVTPASGFQVVATMNGVPSDLPEALRDRFPAAILVSEPHPAALANLPEELRDMARQTDEDVDRRAGVRKIAAFQALRLHTGDDIAARAIFGPRASEIVNALTIRVAPVPGEDDSPVESPSVVSPYVDNDGDPLVCTTCTEHGYGDGHGVEGLDVDSDGDLMCGTCGGMVAESTDWSYT